MTCVVGLIDNATVYIGVDSLGSNGYSKTVRKDKKAFKLQDTSNAIIGFTNSFRMGQILQYSNGLIDNRDEPNIDHKYLVTKFIPNVIEKLENGGFSVNKNGEKFGGTFLLGYKNKLYKIEDDYQVGESLDNYMATGSGEDFALGSLYSTDNSNLSPIERIHKALKSASKFSVGVAPPFYIINTTNNEIIEFKD